MNKIKSLWHSLSERKQMVILFFVQIWTWPQLFWATMPAEIGLPLAFTAISGLLYNAVRVVEAKDD